MGESTEQSNRIINSQAVLPTSSSFPSAAASTGFESDISISLASPSPSAMLEQDAQTFGLRDKWLPWVNMGSPQQMQMREYTTEDG